MITNLDNYTQILIHQLLTDISKKVCFMITHRHNDLIHDQKGILYINMHDSTILVQYYYIFIHVIFL